MKKLLSLILAVMMVISAFSVTALANGMNVLDLAPVGEVADPAEEPAEKQQPAEEVEQESAEEQALTALADDKATFASVYAIVNGQKGEKLEIKAVNKAVGKGTFDIIEIPSYVDYIMLNPKGGEVSDGSGETTPLWTPEYDERGYCAVTRSEGDIDKNTYPPERIVFARTVRPLYPEDQWLCARIKVKTAEGKRKTVYLAWERGADNEMKAVKAENATLFTPVRLDKNMFEVVFDRNATKATFFFKTDAAKAYFTDEQFKEVGAELENKDGFFAAPMLKSDFEGMSRNYYVIVETASGVKQRVRLTAYLRDDTKATPSAVTEYFCLASQYTNNTNNVTGTYGIKPEITLRGIPASGAGDLTSIGNFGGYMIYRFDDLIKNDPNNPYGIDLVVRGNNYSTDHFGFYEPGNVLVSQDGEKWYTLAGSDHYSNNAYWNYTITYKKTDKSVGVYGGGKGEAAEWTDNMGNSGTSYIYPLKGYYPLFPWTDELEKSITVSGVLLIEKEGEFGSVGVPMWGYTDTCYNDLHAAKGLNPYHGGEGGEVFDLDWAVDEKGQPVKLDWVKYVKVQCATNFDGGSTGEKSTEISAIYSAEPSDAPVGVTAAPTSVTINNKKLVLKDGVNVYSAVADSAVTVAVEAPEGANVYINNVYGHNAEFDHLNHRMVRVIVQEGEKEPVIYYVNLITQAEADRIAAAEVEELIAAIGTITKDSGDAIKAARDAYNALTEEQKALVSKEALDTLVKAEKIYDMIIASNKPAASGKAESTGSVIHIAANGAAKGEQNPNTGAPAMSIAPAVLVLKK